MRWDANSPELLFIALYSFIHLPVVTLSDNDSKQTAAATSFSMSALLTLRTFLVKVKKI